MILHHYELSPFSEKIRLMFGYCGIHWQSVISPAMPPRAIVDPLAGGYRRIPVAQIGADIFCDTRIITREIADICAIPEMDVECCGEEIKAFVEHTDSTVFMAAVRSGSPMKSILMLLGQFSPRQTYLFIKDRLQINNTSSLPRMTQSQALQIMIDHKNNMADRLSDSQFLFSNRKPTIADFSAYHLLWFANKTKGEEHLNELPLLAQWFTRMTAFGHAERTELSKDDLFKVASQSSPRTISKQMKEAPLVGARVTIGPSDYAKDTVDGVLVGSSDLRWVLARDSDEFGTLHVHFPKHGFTLTEIS